MTAPLVYVNYGLVADYEELARHGVSVKGAIVIARYGESWRGIKPKLAAEHGAIGCIIYSDPADDGYTQQLPFPKGPMRPAEGAQRGSVLDAPLYPGDPLTPGVAATKEAKRLKWRMLNPWPKFRCSPSRTPTRSRCSRLSKVRSCQQIGAEPCPLPIAWVRGRRRSICSSLSTGT